MNNHNAHLQLLSGILRVYVDGSFESKDRYEWCCTVVSVDSETIELLGVIKPPTKAIWRAIEDCLRNAGYKQVRFTRYRNGLKTTHTISDRKQKNS